MARKKKALRSSKKAQDAIRDSDRTRRKVHTPKVRTRSCDGGVGTLKELKTVEQVEACAASIRARELAAIQARQKTGKRLTKADMDILERLLENAKASVPKSEVKALPAIQTIAQIRQAALQAILSKQANGKNVTGADHDFMREILKEEAEKKSLKKTKVKVEETIAKRLANAQVEVLEVYLKSMRDSKGIAQVQAADRVKLWGEKVELPLEPYEIVDATPKSKKVVSITDAVPSQKVAQQ